MEKKRCIVFNRGQISIFFILGILFLLLLLFFFITTELLSPDTVQFHRRNLEVQFDREALDRYVEYCVVNQSEVLLRELGLKGGTLNTTDVDLHSRTYFGTTYRTLCVQVEGAKYCVNRILSLEDMEAEIGDALVNQLDNCIDFEYLKERGYGVIAGEKDMDVNIGADKITFTFNYPLTIQRDDYELQVYEFYVTMDHSMGLVYRLVLDILNHETTEGYFDKDEWMNQNNMLFSIEENKPYPYITYSIDTDDNFKFNFALELEDKASKVGRNFLYDLEYGCCYIEQNCFKNVDEYSCKLYSGSYERFSQCECNDHFAGYIFPYSELDDCIGRKNGESWCDIDLGVGGRSTKYSCHNGIIYTEECKDFKEEVCVESIEGGLTQSICKPNRWEDCTRCTSQECCENDLLRDCVWMEGNYSVSSESDTKQCAPKMAPGFRFGDGAGQEVCNLGTKYARCSGYSCDEKWVQHASSFCSQIGDCGINENYLGVVTKSGYLETDPDYSAEYLPLGLLLFTKTREQDLLIFSEERESLDLIPSLISAYLNYLDDVSHGRRIVLDYSFCGLWQAPIGGSQCGLCDVGDGCSEYRCSSLGQDCIYKEENGFPKCEQRTFESNMIDINFTSNYSYNTNTIELAGNILGGYEINGAIPAYELLDFEITTSVPTKCKITYMPELTFTETPAIWFGNPEFSTYHNVSFRLPDEIAVPDKLYENLNISSIEELFNLIVENDDQLQDVFEDEFVEVLQAMSEFMESKDYLISLLNLTIAGIDNNTYYTFIRCSDESGNENEEPMYLKFVIDDAYEDTEAPRLLYTIPQNNSELGREPYNLSIFLDEPAECKYSLVDQGYGVMNNNFDCETSRMQLSSIAGGSYECKTTTNIFEPYIRCIDNPPEVLSYAFNVGEGFNQSPVSYYVNGTHITLMESDMFNNTIVYLSNPDALYKISMILPKFYSCRVGFNGFDYDTMLNLNCNEMNSSSPYYSYGSLNCSKKFISGDYTTYVQCIDEIPQNRNMNDKSFSLVYSLNSDLSIVSFFPSYDELIASSNVALGVVVNRNINDHNVNCGYSLNGGSEIYQMYTQGTYQFKRNLYGLLSGQYDVSFSCIDISGSTAEVSTRFVVE